MPRDEWERERNRVASNQMSKFPPPTRGRKSLADKFLAMTPEQRREYRKALKEAEAKEAEAKDAEVQEAQAEEWRQWRAHHLGLDDLPA